MRSPVALVLGLIPHVSLSPSPPRHARKIYFLARIAGGRRALGSERCTSRSEGGSKKIITAPHARRSTHRGEDEYDITALNHDDKRFWDAHLSRIDKPNAKALVQFVDTSIPMGVSVNSGQRSPMLHKEYLKWKKERPRHVILVRVGEFYEAQGIDAILLVQYAGLNPMGNPSNPPRAGCPKQNIQRTLDDLTSQGFSMGVYEEKETPKGRKKERYLAQIVSPAVPNYLKGRLDDTMDSYKDPSPIVGLSRSVSGVTIAKLYADEKKVVFLSSLTDDSLTLLFKTTPTSQIWIHRTSDMMGSKGDDSKFEGKIKRQLRTLIPGIDIHSFSSNNFLTGFIEYVKRDLGFHDSTFEVIDEGKSMRERPLVLDSTAQNLGLYPTRGISPLIDAILPSDAPAACKLFALSLLLNPPPRDTSIAVNKALNFLRNSSVSIPCQYLIPAGKIQSLFSAEEASDTFFREIHLMLTAVRDLLMSDSLDSVTAGILRVVQDDAGRKDISRQLLISTCDDVLREISTTIHNPTTQTPTQDSIEDMDSEIVPFDHDYKVKGNRNMMSMQAFDYFVRSNEAKFEKRIELSIVSEGMQGYHLAKQNLREVLENTMKDIERKIRERNPEDPSLNTRRVTPLKATPRLVFDRFNNAVWIAGQHSTLSESKSGFKRPFDRNMRTVRERWTTTAIEEALNAYRDAVVSMENLVKVYLKSLARKLTPVSPMLGVCATFAKVATLLDLHARESVRKGWSMPDIHEILTDSDKISGETPEIPIDSKDVSGESPEISKDLEISGDYPEISKDSEGFFQINDMWPYWLDKSIAVTNNISIDGMILLTGPNMAGKSTLLRSVCSVALLATAGFAVPAQSALVPSFKSIVLRSASTDSPVEGKSAFAVEMREMRAVTSSAAASSLVFIDELCRGTESTAGSAIAASILRDLDAKNTRGIFSTHLHKILDLKDAGKLGLKNTVEMKMEIADINESDENPYTWKLSSGRSTESLAFQVAIDEGVDLDIIEFSQKLLRDLEQSPKNLRVPHDSLRKSPEYLDGVDASVESLDVSLDTNTLRNPPRVSTGESPESPESPGVPEEKAKRLTASRMSFANLAAKTGDASLVRGAAFKFSMDTLRSMTDSEVFVVTPGQIPGVGTTNKSVVYIICTRAGGLYVGQSDRIKQRLAEHRKTFGGDVIACFSEVSGRGSSTAKSIEGRVINYLRANNLALLNSDLDKGYRSSVSDN